MTYPDWREALGYGGIAFVVLAAFPKTTHRLRWPSRLSRRGVLAYIVMNTIIGFALRTWALPYFKRMADERARAEQELREQLGREPTEDELFAHLGLVRGH